MINIRWSHPEHRWRRAATSTALEFFFNLSIGDCEIVRWRLSLRVEASILMQGGSGIGVQKIKSFERQIDRVSRLLASPFDGVHDQRKKNDAEDDDRDNDHGLVFGRINHDTVDTLLSKPIVGSSIRAIA